MKKKKRFCRYAKKATVPILALAILLTAALIPIGAGPPGAYAADTGATITLNMVSVDKLNDTVVLAADLSEVADDGISAVEFKVEYPDVFTLAKAEDKHLMGEDEKGTGFAGEDGANPYYIAFGSMDKDSGGVNTKTGKLAQFTFKVKDGDSVDANQRYSFQLKDVKAYRITADGDNTPETVNINVNTDSANYTYTPIAGDATAVDNGKITVTKPTEGTAQIKTETIKAAVQTSVTEITLDISSDATDDGEDSVVISKEGAQAVGNADKKLIITADAGRLEFSSKAAEALGTNAEESAITISLEKKTGRDSAGNDVSGVLNVSINAVSNNKNIKSFGNGTVKVDINIPKTMGKNDLKCMFYDLERKQYKFVEGKIKDDIYTFDTTHFSEYMLGDEMTLMNYVSSNKLQQGVAVSGKVQSYNPNNETVLVLRQNGQEVAKAEIARTEGSGQQTQDFSFEAVPAGTYDLVVTKAGHLTYTIEGVVVGSDNLDLTAMTDKAYQTITLLAGDVNGDGYIESGDLNIIWNAANYNKSYENAEIKEADINGDGYVESSDLNIVWNSNNYNKTAATHCTVPY